MSEGWKSRTDNWTIFSAELLCNTSEREEAEGKIGGKVILWLDKNSTASGVHTEVFSWSALPAQYKFWLCNFYWLEIMVFSPLCAAVVFVSAGVQAWSVHTCPPTHGVKIISMQSWLLSCSLLFRNSFWAWSLCLMWFGTVSGCVVKVCISCQSFAFNF